MFPSFPPRRSPVGAADPALAGPPPLGQFTVAGIPVAVGWSVLLLGALLAWVLVSGPLPAALPALTPRGWWAVAALVVLGHLASVTVHQVTEALTARRHGLAVRRVTVALLGGRVELDRPAGTWRAELGAALAGPAASAVLAALAGLGALVATGLGPDGSGPRVVAVALSWLAFGNLALAAVGLLPARPLPGGRVVTALLWARRRDHHRAVAGAVAVSRATGMVLVAVGGAALLSGWPVGLWALVLGWLTVAAAGLERRGVRARGALAGVAVGSLARHGLPTVPDYTTVAEFSTRTRPAHPTAPVFVVTGMDGPVGVLLPRGLRTVPTGDAGRTRVREVATPLSAIPAVPVDADAGAWAARLLRGSLPLVRLVDHQGAFAGVLLLPDLAAAVRARPTSPHTGWLPPDPHTRIG